MDDRSSGHKTLRVLAQTVSQISRLENRARARKTKKGPPKPPLSCSVF